MNIARLIKLAQQKLAVSPFDQGHDLVHHYKVWENCFELILAENLDRINLDYLQIAVWYHDLDRGSEDHPTFVENAKKEGLTEKEIQDIVNIINSHSYSDERSNQIEAKILFDADKVEYIGYSRWLYISFAMENGDMPIAAGVKYAEALNQRIEYIISNLNFKHTKEMFKRNIQAITYLKNHNMLVQEVGDKINWDLLNRLIA